MDNPVPRPLGLAALITATVTLFSPLGVNQSSQHDVSEYSSQANQQWVQEANQPQFDAEQSLADRAVLALRSSLQSTQAGEQFTDPDHRQAQHQPQQPQAKLGPKAETPVELPADIRTARLMLSVESLFKATTPN